MVPSRTAFEWHKQHVIVTGGSGFLGSHLVRHLQDLNAGEVTSLSSQDYDLREKEDVVRMLQTYSSATMVIHLAATVGGIGANRKYPGTFFYDNLMMGVLLLEQVRLARIPKFVGIGTICSYPKITPIPFHEEDLWNGYPEETNAPYGLAKKMLLVQGQAYRAEFGYNAIHLLPVNLYGPGDNFDPETAHVIPDLIRKMTEARDQGQSAVTLWGDGTPTREFLYVKDAVEGIALAAAYYDEGEPVNLGSGFEISIKDLAGIIAREVGFQGEIRWDVSKPNGQPRRQLDTNRAANAFGFRASTSFEDGLRETVAWYQAERLSLI